MDDKEEIYEEVFWGFDIADADFVSILNPEWGKLILNIIDWQERKLEIIFENVLAFNFQHITGNGYRNDSIYKVSNSLWFNEQVNLFKESDPMAVENDINHYKLCFNINEQELNIICSKNICIK